MPTSTIGRRCRRLALFGVLAFFLPAAQVRAQSIVVIGEISWAGSSLSSADEWVELWNADDQPLDLTGYRLLGAGQTNGIPLAGVIAPRSAYLVANYGADDVHSALAATPDTVTTTLSLPNDRLGITLVDAQGNTVDVAGAGNTPPAGLSSPRISMMRHDPLLPGDNPSAWQDAATSTGFDPSIPDLGSPGWCDGCASVEEPPADLPIVPEATSTDPLPPDDTFSSTSTDMTATSTEPDLPPLQDTTSSTIEATSTELAVDTTTTTPSLPPDIRLRELSPNPLDGPEWIDLILRNATDSTMLIGWSLSNSRVTVIRFTTTTQFETHTEDDALFIHVPLSGHRLNNDGETVALRDPTDGIMDHTAYPALEKNQRWSRGTYGDTDWHIEGLLPVVTSAPTVIVSPPAIVQPPTIVTATTTKPTAPAVKRTTATKAATEPKAVTAVKKPAAPVITPTKKPATVKKKTTVPKTTTTKPKTTANPISNLNPWTLTPDDMTALPLRVRVRGTIGTVPKLLAQNQFIILNPDGRGLFVQGNGKQTSPAKDATVELTGTLTQNDQGLRLTMYAKDRWSAKPTDKIVVPRTVDPFAPAQEDVWSLVEVTGTVQLVKGTSVTLDTEDLTVAAVIRPAIGYRAQRLLKGDTVRIRGVIDTRTDEPKLYPRAPDDIVLLHHLPPATTTQPTTNTVPPWSPVAAAGGTLAVGEGWKRLRKIQERRRLKKLLTQAAAQLAEEGG